MTLTSGEVRDSFKYLYPAELPYLKSLVQMLPRNPTVINIGAGAGTSGLAILETRDDVTLVTIDVTDASSPFGCLEAERDVVTRAGLGHLYGQRWFQGHLSSQHLAHIWDVSKGRYGLSKVPLYVDMIFIDGDHSYAGATSDILGWLPFMYNRGIMAVHDYDKGILPPNENGPHPMVWVGVTSAVDDYLVPRFRLVGRVDSLIAFEINNGNERRNDTSV